MTLEQEWNRERTARLRAEQELVALRLDLDKIVRQTADTGCRKRVRSALADSYDRLAAA